MDEDITCVARSCLYKGKPEMNNTKIIILTIIAVSLSSKKKKGGIGTNMGLGLLISFSYILFFQFSSTLSINGNLEPWIAVWIPNILYVFLGILLLRKTQNI